MPWAEVRDADETLAADQAVELEGSSIEGIISREFVAALMARSARTRQGEYAAGGRCAGGFYFFEQARAAQAAGRLPFRGHREMRQFGAPAAGLFLTGHGRIALSAAGFHKEIMARTRASVQRETKWFARRGRFSCQQGEAGAILGIRWRLAKRAGAVYFLLLQSLTGNSNS